MNENDDLSIYGYKEPSGISHAAQRSYERYGIELTNEDLQKMSVICQSKTWMRDYQKPLGAEKHHIHVWYKETWFNLIYSSETKIIVTILHPKCDPKSRL